jgi:IS30 family transposase
MKSTHHFNTEDREKIAEFKWENISVSEIARILGFNKSSVSREIKRNSNKNGHYNPWRAQTLSIMRRKKCKRGSRFDNAPELKKICNFWV